MRAQEAVIAEMEWYLRQLPSADARKLMLLMHELVEIKLAKWADLKGPTTE